MLIDSHCHLNYPGLVERQGEVLARARTRGVTGMLNISIRRSEWADVVATAEREPDVWAAIGIHPNEAAAHGDVDTRTLVDRAAHPKVIGFGESGLDYFRGQADAAAQQRSLRDHIAAARETGLPIIIHTRDAEDDTAAILEEELGRGAYKALIHCFTGTAAFAARMLDAGLSISISGIVTFKNAQSLQEVARTIPADRLLVETDAPFLAPVPHRGKPGEPGFVADTAAFLAALRNEDADQLREKTARNFMRLFDKAQAA